MSDAREFLEQARRHAQCEADGDLDGVMATLIDDPIYLFPTVAGQLRGTDRVYRYYQHFFGDFQPRIEGYELLAEWEAPDSLAQEYALSLSGQSAPQRMVGILYGERLLTGERIYAAPELVRALLGPLFDELEPL